MKYYLVNYTKRRNFVNSGQEIPLAGINIMRAKEGSVVTDNLEDVVLCSGEIHVPRNTAGDWQNSALFLSRSDISRVIDFFVRDGEIFEEVAAKVFARANELIKEAK